MAKEKVRKIKNKQTKPLKNTNKNKSQKLKNDKEENTEHGQARKPIWKKKKKRSQVERVFFLAEGNINIFMVKLTFFLNN